MDQHRRLSAITRHVAGPALVSQSWPSMHPEKNTKKPKLAIVSTEWRQNSHSEHMGDCFMHGWGLGGVWHEPAVEVVSMCTPCLMYPQPAKIRCLPPAPSANRQHHPQANAPPSLDPHPSVSAWLADVDQASGGVDRDRAAEFGFTLYDDIGEALRCGGDQIAVDCVLIIGE